MANILVILDQKAWVRVPEGLGQRAEPLPEFQRAWNRGPKPGSLGHRAKGHELGGLGKRVWANKPGPEGLIKRS